MSNLSCYRCKKILGCDKFHRDNTSKRGYQKICKQCSKGRVYKTTKVRYKCTKCNKTVNYIVDLIRNKSYRKKLCYGCSKHKLTGSDSPLYRGTKYFTGKKYSAWKQSAAVRKLKWTLSKKKLEKLYEKQEGLCALSGLPLEKSGPLQISLDRIDSKKPYPLSNVQFVCSVINLMKNKYSEEDFVYYCTKVAEYNKC